MDEFDKLLEYLYVTGELDKTDNKDKYDNSYNDDDEEEEEDDYYPKSKKW